MKIRLIVNPRAAAGSAGRRIRDISGALQGARIAHDIVHTTRPGDASGLARRAIDDGVDVIAIVGGDGTVNEVCQAYLDAEGAPVAGPDLALFPAGTGGDFRRTFGLSERLEDAVERLRSGSTRPLDLGIIELEDDSGAPVRKAFVNVMSFGIGGHVDRIVNQGPKWMGGRAAFFIGSLRAMATYSNAPVAVTLDGEKWFEGRVVNVAVANGQYFGGGMRIAPEADPSDGRFDVVAIGDLTLGESLGLSSRLYSGRHLDMPKVRHERASLVEARPLGSRPVLIDLDGEAPGRLPLRARIAAGALRLRV